jgi:hypothetical protein
MMDKAKNISVIIGAFMALYGVYSLFASKIIEKDRQTQSEMVQEKIVKDLMDATTTIKLNLDTLKLSQDKVMIKLDANTKATNAVIVGFKKHLKATDRLEELLNFYEF